MFMEFSSNGDLNFLCKEHHGDLNIEEEMTAMIQIAPGVTSCAISRRYNLSSCSETFWLRFH